MTAGFPRKTAVKLENQPQGGSMEALNELSMLF